MNDIEDRIRKAIEKLNSKDDFTHFLDLFFQDYKDNKSKWENVTLDDFLSALVQYSRDVDRYYKNFKNDVDPNEPSWRLFADILCGARVYE